MISHDREFLNHTRREHRRDRARETRSVIAGTGTTTSSRKPRAKNSNLAAYKNQQKEIASLQLFADRFRAKASKASQAQSKLKQIDRMEKIAAPIARGKTINSISRNRRGAVCA